ncbi:MAG: MerR family transcriptional regulator [Cyanosarcina radialis HA8281-LM2]|jgi:DNA-binding transcriptional MerR regulator|nr:MerR family transcriptional regulator [Cyanosarcina radialis HA8281-LM2]
MPSQKSNLLRIGQVASRSGIPIKTLRYYDELGLLRSPARSSGGFRLFSVDVFERLTLIKGAQNLGLKLQEIKELLQICEQHQCPGEAVRQKIEKLIQAIDRAVDRLQSFQVEIERLIARWGQENEDISSRHCHVSFSGDRG